MQNFLKTLLFLIVPIMIGTTCFSQNYQTLNSGNIILYKNSEDIIRAVKPVGTLSAADSIFTSFNVINQISAECYSPEAGSWIGKQIIIKDNFENIFFNRNSDSILIKSNADLGQSWQVYHDNYFIIFAQVTEVDTLTFCEINDSVKEITFQVFDLAMNPTTHDLNNMSIILSKSCGLVKTLNFFNFPENTITGYEHYSPPLEEYEICGIQNSIAGTQNLRYLDVYDFQSGDQLHIDYSRVLPCCSESTQTILKYLERDDIENRIEYRVEREYFQQLSVYGTPSETYVHDTITEIYEPWYEFDLLPGEIIINENLAYCFKMTDGDRPIKTPLDKGGMIQFSEPECWTLPVFEGCSSGNYIKGLGGPYFHCETSESLTIKELVYYSSGGETWGQPLIISEIKNISSKNITSVFPNPSSGSFNLDLPNDEKLFNLNIYSCEGQLVFSEYVNGGKTSVNCDFLKNGIYQIMISDTEAFWYSAKLIIIKP